MLIGEGGGLAAATVAGGGDLMVSTATGVAAAVSTHGLRCPQGCSTSL